MGRCLIPAATRRALRPYKLGIALAVIAGACLYGSIVGGNAAEDVSGVRRLSGEVVDDSSGDGSSPETPSNAKAAIYLLGLLYMFLALSMVCDEYFVPALEVITEKLQLSPDIAGATFMAAGGSAPEFFTSMVGALAKPPSDVGIATIVGSAVFNVLFVIGACGIAAPTTLQLTGYPLARDSIFYVVHLVLLVVWFWDGLVEWWESAIQFVMYLLYCIFMAYSQRIEDKINDRLDYANLDSDKDGYITREEAKKDKDVADAFDQLDADHDGKLTKQEVQKFFRHRRQMRAVADEQPEGEEEAVSLMPPPEKTCKAIVYYIVSLPIQLVLFFTVPDVRRKSPGTCWRSLYPVTFALSIIWVAIFSYIMVFCSAVVGAWTQIDQRILAMTLLAAGTSVPDLLTSVLVTWQGHGDMAISSSIGSNIFDVTVGLPIPWLCFSAYYSGEPIKVFTTPKTMLIQIGALVAMLIAVIVSIMVSKWQLAKPLGYLMLVLYILFMCVSIWQVLQE